MFFMPAERLIGILKKDGRFSISIGNRSAVTLAGGYHYLFGGKLLTHDPFILSGHLGNVSVLAEEATKVATNSGYGVCATSRLEVEQWLLLHRVHVPGYCPTVYQAL